MLLEGDAEGRLSRWRCRAAAGIAALAGLTTLAAQLSTRAPSALAHRSTVGGAGALALHALGVAGGVGLLVLAHGLWREKRRAAYVAAGVLCLIAAGRAGLGLGPLNAGVDLLLAGVVLANIGAFKRGKAPAGRGVAISGTIALVGAAGLYAAYALTILVATHRTDTDQAIAAAGRGLVAGAWWVGTNWWVRLILDGLIATTIVAGAAFLHGLLRPARPSDGHSPDQHDRALSILRRHGSDSLDPFALREDKALHFASGGFLSYRVLRETAVVSGDPIGPPASATAILASFLRFARQRGWDVVVTGASGRQLDGARALGLRALRIGQEAVVDPAHFSLEGRAIRKVRQSVTRARRRGWRVETVKGTELTPQLASELHQVEAEWRASQPRLVGFAMTLGRLAGADEDEGAVYLLGRDPQGRLRSFLRFAAFRDGLSLDLTRRVGDEPNGLTEAQVVAAIDYARQRGMRGVSLNFAGFAHVMAADAALNRSQRLLRLALRALHGRFQLERLLRFNAKFFPAWQPRYLLYGRLTHLPLAALRVLQAEAYLPGPRERRMPGRWEAHPSPVESSRPSSHGWRPWAVAAAVLLAALAVPTELLVARIAHARPLHVRARLDRANWSFTYARTGASPTSPTLYLPEGRPVTLRFNGGAPGTTPVASEAAGQEEPERLSDQPLAEPGTGRTLRLRALRPGRLSVPCAADIPRACVIRADVVRPGALWERLEQSRQAEGAEPPSPVRDPDRVPHSE